MQRHSRAKALTISTILAASMLSGATTALAAGTPGDVCAAAVAKNMAKCTKKVIGLHAKCYKDTGEACRSTNSKLTDTVSKTRDSVTDKCPDGTAIANAGYGTYSPTNLGTHFGDLCKATGLAVTKRAFGADGSRFTGADDDGKKCLQTASKESAKYISSSLGDVSKCVATGCSFDFTEDATSMDEKVTGKCPTFVTLVGTTVADFVASTTEQIHSAIAAPCDPLDGTRCAFPYPNDYFSIPSGAPSGRQLALGRNAFPANSEGTPLTTTRFNDADGFSIGPMLLVNDVNIDLTVTGAAPITDLAKSLEANAPVVIIDAETGDKQLLWVERDGRGATVADQPIIIRVGRNLQEGRRYIVAMRNMKDSMGAAVSAPAAFTLYRDSLPTALVPVEARRAHMEEIFTALTSAGIARNELYLAWDFTTQSSQSVSGKLLAMRDDAFTDLGAAAPAFTVTGVVDNPDANSFRQVDGTFQVPLYLDSAADPGLVSSPVNLRLDSKGVPVNQGSFTAKFRCTIPNAATTGGAAPAVPARIAMYGHGLLGLYSQVTGSPIRDFSSEHNIIQCATDWTGFADGDAIFVTRVVKDFSIFPNFIERQHQGMLNFMMLGRLMQHASGFASAPAFQVDGESMIDDSDLFYDGNSQGGILGGVLAAFSQDATRFVLGVPGMNYSTLLNRSVDFDEFDVLLQAAYPSSTDRNLLLSLAQVLWDRTDPSGHINHVTSDPYAGTPAKKLLYQVAFGDHQVAPVTAEVAARSNGTSIHTPVLSPGKVVPEVTPYYDIPAIGAYPFDGSALVIWDSGNPAPPINNFPPANITPMDAEWADLGPCAQSATGGDPHSCPRKNVNARLQKSEFLKTNGMVVDVCGGAACLAP